MQERGSEVCSLPRTGFLLTGLLEHLRCRCNLELGTAAHDMMELNSW